MAPVPPKEAESRPDTTRARYRRILRFAAWNLVITWFFELFLPRVGLRKVADRNRSVRMQRFAQRFRVLAVGLGGLMIKVGQFMSSRLDVLPPELTAELEGLQDEVSPVPFVAIRMLAEIELGAPLEARFSSIEQTPIAAASLGQVHRARLLPQDASDTGMDAVVVKIQRPHIEEIIAVDLAALRKVAGWLSRLKVVSKRVNAPALVEEFAATSLEEVDYLYEASNLERFTRDFAGDERLTIPRVAWERCTRRVLTLEDVTAIKITDTQTLVEAGIDPSQVAPVFAEIMFDQLFINGFFHADPHPGNIFVTPSPDSTTKHQWKLTFIDFGMMGEVSPGTRSGLRKLLISAAARNGKGLVQAISEIGVLVPSAETTELERAMTQLFSRFGGMGFSELKEVDPREFRDFATEFGEVVRSLPFQLPENFLLIIRAMSLTSGVCSALEPKFNLWDSIEPYSGQLLRNERGNLLQDVSKKLLETAGTAFALPQRVEGLLRSIDDGSLAVGNPRLERRVAALERSFRRLVSMTVFAALLITGASIRGDDYFFGNVFMVASLLPLFHGLWVGHRR